MTWIISLDFLKVIVCYLFGGNQVSCYGSIWPFLPSAYAVRSVYVCLWLWQMSVQAMTFEPVELGISFWLYRYILTTFRLHFRILQISRIEYSFIMFIYCIFIRIGIRLHPLVKSTYYFRIKIITDRRGFG